jgi:hypothetical protein
MSSLSLSLDSPKPLKIGLFWKNKAELGVVGPRGFEPTPSGDVTRISLFFSRVGPVLSTYDTAVHLMI